MELDKAKTQTLAQAAIDARQRAYAPYSQFRVGAALWLASGRIITGGNVENASYGLTLCAERAALVAAVAQGAVQSDLYAMAIAVDAADIAAPCGACRQVIVELCPKAMPIILINKRDGARKTCTIAELLPHAFGPQSLGPSQP